MMTRRLLLGLFLLLATAPAWAQAQRMAVPAYFYPGPLWTQLGAAAPTVGLAVINPNSGPGLTRNPDYAAVVREMQSHGVIVLGYVHIGYTKRDIKGVGAEAAHFSGGTG